jgi:hypothetical protein
VDTAASEEEAASEADVGTADEVSAGLADEAAEDSAGSDELAGRLDGIEDGIEEATTRVDVPAVAFVDIATRI